MSTNYLLPQNIDELLNRFEELQSDIFDRLNLVSKKIGTLRDPHLAPEEFLKPLAKDLQTYFLFMADTEEKKREAIAHSLYLHRIKGTKKAIEIALESNGFPAKIEEWWEYDGEPYFFRVSINIETGFVYSQKNLKKIIALVEHFKNVRSWLDELRLRLEAQSRFGISSAMVLEALFSRDINFGATGKTIISGGLEAKVEFQNRLELRLTKEARVYAGAVYTPKATNTLNLKTDSKFNIRGAMVWNI